MHTLNLIGAGRAGQTLARLWSTQGLLQVQAAVCRRLEHAHAAVDFIGSGQPLAGLEQLPAADLWLIATPDDQIAGVAAQLAQNNACGGIAFHLSGSLTAAALTPLRACGMALASTHPIKSFANPALACEQFAGSACGVEGDTAALAQLEPLLQAIGATILRIDPAHKTLYHAGSTIACNYLVTLVEAGVQCLAAAGIPHPAATAALLPLLQGTLDNIGALGTTAALTGPIARGDSGTVTRHLTAIHADLPHLAGLYAGMGRQTLQLAAARLTPEQVAALAAALQQKK